MLGTLGMLALAVVVGRGSNGFSEVPLAVVGSAAAPAAGSLLICAIGRSSRAYEGPCSPAVTGGYIGALGLGLSLGLLTLSTNAGGFGDDGEREQAASFAIGALLGVIIGTVVGATIGWNHNKRLREDRRRPVPLFAPPLPPPAALESWPELRLRPSGPPAGVAVGVSLLSLRF
jgi:drug/metabolite transporter (DMT)-like permease